MSTAAEREATVLANEASAARLKRAIERTSLARSSTGLRPALVAFDEELVEHQGSVDILRVIKSNRCHSRTDVE